MNPLVKNYLRQIEQSTTDLSEILAERRERALLQKEARDALQQEVWRRKKEISVMQESVANYDDLKEENEVHRKREDELSERLRKVLAYTHALTEEVRR